MRPRGEISVAVESCLAQLGSATFDEIARKTNVGRAVVQRTLHNMLTCARVEVLERRQDAGASRPKNVYRLRLFTPPNGTAELQRVMYILAASANGSWNEQPAACSATRPADASGSAMSVVHTPAKACPEPIAAPVFRHGEKDA